MIKTAFRILMLLVICPCTLWAQSGTTDTLRTNRAEAVAMELGSDADLITVGGGLSSNWFISLGGGVNFLSAEGNRLYNNAFQRLRPTADISVGRWFTPALALRFQAGAGQLSGHYYGTRVNNIYDRFPNSNDHFTGGLQPLPGEEWVERKFTYLDFQFNLMTDILQWGSPKSRQVGLYLYAGPGFAHAFDSQNLGANNSFAFKGGLQLDVRIGNRWSLYADLQGTVVDETFDGMVGGYDGDKNRTVEGYLGFTAGVTYRFGGRKFKRYAKVDPVILETVFYEREPEVIEEIAVIDQEITLPFVVRFRIDKYNIEDDQMLNIYKVAQYLRDHPAARLDLTGYADRETAYPAYNLKLSQRRVKSVKDYLVGKYGILPSRISTDAKGDAERLYNEDYRWNRAVVMQIVIQ